MYTVHRQLLSIGRDYRVENAAGETVFKIDGKVRFARTFLVRDANGQRLLRVREKLWSLQHAFLIDRDGQLLARLHRTTFASDRHARYEIEMDGVRVMEASGDLFRESVRLNREDGLHVGSVSRKQHAMVHESFYMNVVSEEDQALGLALLMAIVESTTDRGEDE